MHHWYTANREYRGDLDSIPRRTVVSRLRSKISFPIISTVLVGFGNQAHVQEALRAVERFDESRFEALEQIKAGAGAGFEGLCTGCQYCDHCPEEIPIPKLMDAFNHRLLLGDDEKVVSRLKMHWGLSTEDAAKCIACGICEGLCTQHLPIIQRLAKLAELQPAQG